MSVLLVILMYWCIGGELVYAHSCTDQPFCDCRPWIVVCRGASYLPGHKDYNTDPLRLTPPEVADLRGTFYGAEEIMAFLRVFPTIKTVRVSGSDYATCQEVYTLKTIFHNTSIEHDCQVQQATFLGIHNGTTDDANSYGTWDGANVTVITANSVASRRRSENATTQPVTVPSMAVTTPLSITVAVGNNASAGGSEVTPSASMKTGTVKCFDGVSRALGAIGLVGVVITQVSLVLYYYCHRLRLLPVHTHHQMDQFPGSLAAVEETATPV